TAAALGVGNQPMRALRHEIVAQPQRAAGDVTAVSLEDRAPEPVAGQLEIPARPTVPFHVPEHVAELHAGEGVINRRAVFTGTGEGKEHAAGEGRLIPAAGEGLVK